MTNRHNKSCCSSQASGSQVLAALPASPRAQVAFSTLETVRGIQALMRQVFSSLAGRGEQDREAPASPVTGTGTGDLQPGPGAVASSLEKKVLQATALPPRDEHLTPAVSQIR